MVAKLKRMRWYGGLLIAVASLITGQLVVFQTGRAVADNSSVSAQFPKDGYYIDGKVSFSFSVQGLSVSQYEPFWAVDNGVWVRMDQPTGGANPTASVDVSKWTWRADNTYKLSFIALQKSNWQPIKQDMTIHIGSPLSQMLTDGTVPTASVNTVSSTTPVAAVASLASPATNLTGKTLYADPTNSVAVQTQAWAKAHPADANGMNYLAKQPLANWFGNWNGDVQAASKSYVDAATTAGKVPVLVAYNIPQRDCGSYSAGGVSNADAYSQWISQLANGIGKRQALVIVEPDAIAGMDCLSAADQTARLGMLRSAVTTLKQQTNATVYLDAGHPGWHSASYMADKLKDAGVTDADGFSLNVSNYDTTPANVTYGTAVSKAIGNAAHFVIDTSRNGSGSAPNNQWCNPAGRAVGHAPTLTAANESGSSLVDAYLWVNVPGGSDGSCGPTEEGSNAPVAGVWWPQSAREMLLNSDLL